MHLTVPAFDLTEICIDLLLLLEPLVHVGTQTGENLGWQMPQKSFKQTVSPSFRVLISSSGVHHTLFQAGSQS